MRRLFLLILRRALPSRMKPIVPEVFGSGQPNLISNEGDDTIVCHGNVLHDWTLTIYGNNWFVSLIYLGSSCTEVYLGRGKNSVNVKNSESVDERHVVTPPLPDYLLQNKPQRYMHIVGTIKHEGRMSQNQMLANWKRIRMRGTCFFQIRRLLSNKVWQWCQKSVQKARDQTRFLKVWFDRGWGHAADPVRIRELSLHSTAIFSLLVLVVVREPILSRSRVEVRFMAPISFGSGVWVGE